MALIPSAHSQSSWQVDGTGNWFTGSNWAGGTPGAGSAAGINTPFGSATLSSGKGNALSVDVGTFYGDPLYASAQLTIQGSGHLTVGGGNGIVSLGTLAESDGYLTIGGARVLDSGLYLAETTPGTLSAGGVVRGNGSGVVSFNHGSSAYTFSANLTGVSAGNVGSGKTILSGTAENVYLFATGGTLEVSGPSTNASLVSASSGGSLAISGDLATSSIQITQDGNLQVLSGGSIVGGNSTFFVVDEGSRATVSGATASVSIGSFHSDSRIGGDFGSGGSGSSLTIQNGADFSAGGGELIVQGDLSGNSSLIVTGSGSTFMHAGELILSVGSTVVVSNGGTLTTSIQSGAVATIDVTSGGTLTANATSISGGNVTVTGAGSLFSVNAPVNFPLSEFGSASDISVNINAGGKLSTTDSISFGSIFDGSNATVMIAGAGSSLEGNFFRLEQGNMTVTNGATVEAAGFDIQNGQVVVSGAGITVGLEGFGGGNMTIGSSDVGTGSLRVTSGAVVTSFYTVIGNSQQGTGGTGQLSVTGSGSQFNVSEGQIVVGDDSANGSLTISSNGVVNVTSTDPAYDPSEVILTTDSNGTALLQIGTGGAAGLLNAQRVIGGGGNATILFNHTDSNYDFAPDISGEVNVVYSGSGTTILSGNNTFSGSNTVDSGTLVVNGATGSGAIFIISENATLQGNGTVSGNTTVAGTLSPGNSPGLLTFEGDLTLEATSDLVMELNGTGAGQFDQIFVGGMFAAGGILQLTVNYAAQRGDSFTLITSGGYDSGSFLINTNLGGGLYWNTSDLASGGIVSVVPEPSTYALLALGGAALFLISRRKKQTA